MANEKTQGTKQEKTEGRFDRVYSLTKEMKEQMKKPFKRSQSQRKIESAYTDCQLQILDLESNISDLKDSVLDLQINKILELTDRLNVTKTQLTVLEDLYFEMFAEKLPK